MLKKKNRNITLPIILVSAGLFLVLLALITFFNPDRNVYPQIGDVQTLNKNSNADISRINVEKAKIAIDAGSAVIIDVRGEPFYSNGHIPGSLSISEEDLPKSIKDLNPSDMIITYCT